MAQLRTRCRRGCISQHACWRVKDHNKRRVVPDKTGISTLARGLGILPSPAACIHERKQA
jgi:hypothetical protein